MERFTSQLKNLTDKIKYHKEECESTIKTVKIFRLSLKKRHKNWILKLNDFEKKMLTKARRNNIKSKLKD